MKNSKASKFKKIRESLLALPLSPMYGLVLLLFIGLTILAWSVSKLQYQQSSQHIFENQKQNFIELFVERMEKYVNVSRSGIATFYASDFGVTPKEWHRFVGQLVQKTSYPALKEIGVIFKIPRAIADGFVSDMRKYYPNFEMKSAGTSRNLWPIAYTGHSKHSGIDLNQSEGFSRLIAEVEQLRGPRLRSIDASYDIQSHLDQALFFHPLYEWREDQMFPVGRLMGGVYLIIDFSELLYGSLSTEFRQIQIRLRTPDTILLDEFDKMASEISVKRLNLYGQKLELSLKKSEQFYEVYKDRRSDLILVFGVLFAALLYFLLITTSNAHRKAVALAKSKELEAALQKQAAYSASRMAALGEFAAQVSHEIRNPLNLILNFSNMLSDLVVKNPDKIQVDVYRRLTKKIEHNITKINQIIEGLKNLSREGKLDHFEICAVGKVLDEVISLTAQTFKKNHIDLNTRIESELQIKCQRVQLTQVLLNLLSNAKYAALQAQGNAWVKIAAYAKEGSLFLEVSDSGPGIPADKRDNLFRPFFTTKPFGEGTGLGLSISEDIIKAHQGEIFLDESKDFTTFTVKIPLAL